MTQTTLGLHFGALCDPLRKQLHDQGLKIEIEKLEHFQKDADALTRLLVRGIISYSPIERARKKLVILIAKEAEPL